MAHPHLLHIRSYCGYAAVWRTDGRDLETLIDSAADALETARRCATASDTLPVLIEAQQQLARAVDETMAAAVLEEGASLRQAGQLADLSENAVGPRLARTARLSPYATPEGRVTRTSVERARYDAELGRPAPRPGTTPAPMRFRRRRDT
jgi:hypothetical protein